MKTNSVDRFIVGSTFKAGNGVSHTINKKEEQPKQKHSTPVLPIVSSAVAIAALTTSIISTKRINTKFSKNNELASKAEEMLKQQLAESTQKISELKQQLAEKLSVGEKRELESKIESLERYVSGITSKLNYGTKLYTRPVQINGEYFSLADIELNKVDKDVKAKMIHTLQTEATRRMLGLTEGVKSLPENGWIRYISSEYKGIASTGGMSIVPKEELENLAVMTAGVQKMNFGIDIPLYRGNVEKSEIKGVYTRLFNKLKYNENTGRYDYVQVKLKDGIEPTESVLAKNLKKVDTMYFDLYDADSKSKEIVDVYIGSYEKPFDYTKKYDLLDAEVKTRMEKMSNNTEFEWGNLVVRKDNQGNISTSAKITQIFYDNGTGGKFDINVAGNYAKDIYTNQALSAGETERFMFFDRCITEQLYKHNEVKGAPGVDLFVGNDWQSGGVAAILRLKTPVKQAYGEIDPILGDKLYNTPFVAIDHNAGLSGGAWHSQPKILNMLFDKYTATIAENAFMPNVALAEKNAGLNAPLYNGLMEGSGVNPLTMLTAYSDYFIPVSEGYAKEIVAKDIFGGARKQLYEIRAKEGIYSDLDNIKLRANQNGISTDMVKSNQPTLIGITNGCDKANNTLTSDKVTKLEQALHLPSNTFLPYQEGIDRLQWHNHNKQAGINKVIADINEARLSAGKQNPMQIEMPEMTDLTGVTVKTPVFVSAGRIVEQKGLDIFAKSIVEFYKNFKGTDYPVFYTQGIGDPKFKEAFLAAKKEVAKSNPEAAKRMVFANLFSEPGRYDLSKIIADFSVMPSWFEPCGLSHKEIGQFSGAGAVVNRTGGLVSDLKEGVNVIVSEFNPEKSALEENGKNFAKALHKAVDIHANDAEYKKVIDAFMDTNFDWARPNGPIYKYTEIFEKLGVLSHDAANATIK